MSAEVLRDGLMLVLSSPSGAGKTTLARGLLAKIDNIDMSVSLTTRPMRPGERDGVDYHFVTLQKFEALKKSHALLEYAKVFDYYYATKAEPVKRALAEGRDVLFDIDWQGTQTLLKAGTQNLVRVFILPPSARELEQRLRMRAQDSADLVAKRMSKAAIEISHYAEYDYVVINWDIEDSLKKIQAIVIAERLRRERQKGLVDFVKTLYDDL